MRETLAELGIDGGAADDAELLVSELVTNAVLHARSAMRVTVDRRDGALRVSVSDRSPVPPRLRDYGPDAVTGRGMLLVDRLARSWGVERHQDEGKQVWFELDFADGRGVPAKDLQT